MLDAYAPLYGGEANFVREFTGEARRCFRVNTLRAQVGEVHDRLRAQGYPVEEVPWCPGAFFTEGKPGTTPEAQLGLLYGQDAASLLPALALAPEPGESILDMCAAPGSKSTHMAALMRNEGRIVANDKSRGRAFTLIAALQRCGVANAVVTVHDATRPTFTTKQFDRVLVDAPCSTLGRMGETDGPIRAWNPERVARLVQIQGSLLDAAWRLTRKGGTLVYATCTIDPSENEGVVTSFLRAHSDVALEPLPVAIRGAPAVQAWRGKRYDPAVKDTLRLNPTTYGTEGFYVARFRKG